MENKDRKYTAASLGNQISFLAGAGMDIDPIAGAIFQGLDMITGLASRSVVAFFQNQFSQPMEYEKINMAHGYLATVNGEETKGDKQPPNKIYPLSEEEKEDKRENVSTESTQIVDGDTLVFKSHKGGLKGTKGSLVYNIEGTTEYFKDSSATEIGGGSGNVYGSICLEWDKPGDTGDTTYKATFTSLDLKNANVGAYIRLTSQDVGESVQGDITGEPSNYNSTSGVIETEIPNAGGHDNNLIIEIIPVSIDFLNSL